jgi:predicted esterase
MSSRPVALAILIALLLPLVALAQDPREAGSYAEMRAYLGELYEQQKYAEGAALLERALDRYPDQVLANTYNLAILRGLAGDPGGGVEALEEGLRRGVFYGIWDFEDELLAPLKAHERFADFWQRNLARLEAAQSQASMQMELVLPEGYDAAQAYPLFVALHGGGEDLAAFKPNWASPRLRAEFITLYVQSSQVANMRGFHWQDEALTRRDLTAAYAQAVAQHRIASDRVLVGGFSSGGYAALLAAFHEILPVRGFVALCPAVPDSITDAQIAAAARRGLRGSLLTTELDNRLAAQRELAERWRRLGFAGEIVVTPDAAHWYPEDFSAQLDAAIAGILAPVAAPAPRSP